MIRPPTCPGNRNRYKLALTNFSHFHVVGKAMMLFRSKREEKADCRYRCSCNRPHRLLVSKTRVVSNTDDIGQK